MNIKKYLYVGISIFVALVLVAIGTTSRFNWSNISGDFYAFVEKFFSQWSPALSAAGTLIVAGLAFLAIYESRRREAIEQERVMHALHGEIHFNLSQVNSLLIQIGVWLECKEKFGEVPDSIWVTPNPFCPLETRVFNEMTSRGQLQWLEDLEMRTFIPFCYELIKKYNADGSYKTGHEGLLTTLEEQLGKSLVNLEAKFRYLPVLIKMGTARRLTESEDDSTKKSDE